MWKKTIEEINQCIKTLRKLQKKLEKDDLTEYLCDSSILENAILTLKEMKGSK